jgi:hypothetical protein
MTDDEIRMILEGVANGINSALQVLTDSYEVADLRIQMVVSLGGLSMATGMGYDLDEDEGQREALFDAVTLVKSAAEMAGYNFRETIKPGGMEALFEPKGQG